MQNMLERIMLNSMAKISVESGEVCEYKELGEKGLCKR